MFLIIFCIYYAFHKLGLVLCDGDGGFPVFMLSCESCTFAAPILLEMSVVSKKFQSKEKSCSALLKSPSSPVAPHTSFSMYLTVIHYKVEVF